MCGRKPTTPIEDVAEKMMATSQSAFVPPVRTLVRVDLCETCVLRIRPHFSFCGGKFESSAEANENRIR